MGIEYAPRKRKARRTKLQREEWAWQQKNGPVVVTFRAKEPGPGDVDNGDEVQ